MILYCAVTTALALAISWLIYSWSGKLFRGSPGEAAGETLSLVLIILGVLALPVLANLTINGLAVTWIPPEPASFFLGLLSLIQGLFVAVLGLALAGVAALAAWVTRLSSGQAAVKIAESPAD